MAKRIPEKERPAHHNTKKYSPRSIPEGVLNNRYMRNDYFAAITRAISQTLFE